MNMLCMSGAEALRNKALQRMSKGFARIAAKHLFGGGVEQKYSLFLVDGEDRIFRGFDYAQRNQIRERCDPHHRRGTANTSVQRRRRKDVWLRCERSPWTFAGAPYSGALPRRSCTAYSSIRRYWCDHSWYGRRHWPTLGIADQWNRIPD